MKPLTETQYRYFSDEYVFIHFEATISFSELNMKNWRRWGQECVKHAIVVWEENVHKSVIIDVVRTHFWKYSNENAFNEHLRDVLVLDLSVWICQSVQVSQAEHFQNIDCLNSV